MPTNGLVVMTPTSIASTGTGNSSSINADGSVDFASCATLSLNGVFTSSYDNYMITMRSNNNSSDTVVEIRLRASGTDSTSGYTNQQLYANGTTIYAGRYSATTQQFFSSSSTTRVGNTGYFFGPYLSQATAMRSTTIYGQSSAALLDFAATHSTASSYDGITFLPQAGLIAGLVTVFGFNQ